MSLKNYWTRIALKSRSHIADSLNHWHVVRIDSKYDASFTKQFESTPYLMRLCHVYTYSLPAVKETSWWRRENTILCRRCEDNRAWLMERHLIKK